MLFDQVSIETVVAELPPVVVSSAEIERRLSPVYDRLKLPYGRLEMMTGIRERRFWLPGTRPSKAASFAGKKALAQAEMSPGEIGCLIHASVCRDFMEPATASIVHDLLDLPPTAAMFDLSNACLGVMNGMVTIANMIQLGQIDAGLVVSGECAEGLHEATVRDILKDKSLTRNGIKKHFASLTIGSGAAAVILRRRDQSRTGHRLLGGAVRTDSQANHLCREDTTRTSDSGPLMATDAEGLLHAGCRLAAQTWEAAKQELGWDNDTPAHFFTHQVGSVHKRLIFETLGIDPQKDFPTVAFTGNTGSAALPTALALGCVDKKISALDHIALLGIGSGLSSLILGIEWQAS
jgi:3-oxoacyl-[acyl-carrier-protein] synthase-3